jgi:hypothetical protein
MHLDFLQKKIKRTCSFVGEKGRLDWDLFGNKITKQTKLDKTVLFSEKDWDTNQMYISVLKDFFNFIKGEKNTCVDLQQAFATVDLVQNIKNQAIQGVKQ